MQAPKSLAELEQVLTKIELVKRKAPNQVFLEVEHELVKQEKFLREQNRLIEDAMKSFRSLVCLINVLNNVARVMGIALKKQSSSDDEKVTPNQQK